MQDVSLDFLRLTVPREREGREVMKSVSGHPSYFSLEKVQSSLGYCTSFVELTDNSVCMLRVDING